MLKHLFDITNPHGTLQILNYKGRTNFIVQNKGHPYFEKVLRVEGGTIYASL